MPTNDHEQSGVALVDALAEVLLGQRLTLTSQDLAMRAGVQTEINAARWRTMGYPEIADGDVAFTKSDVELLKAAERLLSMGTVDQATAEAFIRTVGRTFSRLAEWQVRAMIPSALDAETGQLSAKEIRKLSEMLELGAKVQENVWRRHLFGAATRLVLQNAVAMDSEPGCAGFVDIVGYTSRSRSMTGQELTALVDRFESVVSDLITKRDGRVVKTIGDEIFFVVDNPVEAARLGVELAEQHVNDGTFPNVRVGMAYGDLLHRLGDVLGPTVNMASRLTSVATPGRVIIDATLAEHVKESPDLRVRKMRRMNIKGFEPVELWSLKAAQLDRRSGLRGAMEGLIEDATEELAMRLPQRSG